MNSPRSACAIPSRTAARKRHLPQADARPLLHQPFGTDACVGGDLRKLRFLLGREMYFHGFSASYSEARGNRFGEKVSAEVEAFEEIVPELGDAG